MSVQLQQQQQQRSNKRQLIQQTQSLMRDGHFACTLLPTMPSKQRHSLTCSCGKVMIQRGTVMQGFQQLTTWTACNRHGSKHNVTLHVAKYAWSQVSHLV
jgi:predicted RNA-binding protein Jag